MTNALAKILVGLIIASAVAFAAIGPASAGDFHFVKTYDKASPKLF